MSTFIEAISHYLQNSVFTALFFDAWLKSLTVLAVAGGMCILLHRAAAATRHWIWLLALASLPCLLLLAWVPRSWQRPLWSVSTGFNSGNQVTFVLDLAPTSAARSSATSRSPARAIADTASEGGSRNSHPLTARFSAGALVLAVTIWLIGAGLGVLSVLAGRVQLRRLARNGATVLVGTRSTASLKSLSGSGTRRNASLPARPASTSGGVQMLQDGPLVQAADWALLLQEARDRLRLRRPVRLLQSSDNPMPLTWGWWRPVILLPAEATSWPSERRRIVLLHELAHAKRLDCLTQTVARMVCALYWINPLVWLAARRMCIERERACDDLVLNSGCRASDYATHLVDIARAFGRAPQFAGIAMARSPQLQGRIAAIVDPSRARQLRPVTALAILALMGLLALSVGGSSPDASRNQAEDSVLRQRQITRLQSFAQAKEKQSQELAAKAGEKISPEFRRFFTAAIKGDWRTVTNRYAFFRQNHPQYARGTNAFDVNLRTAFWQPVLELCLAYDQVVNCDPKYTAMLADGIINSIPAGSIYFGGTDPGRGVPTAFSKSQVSGDPFFTLTQNALADGTYLEYLRTMYGGKIYTPTDEDSQQCFRRYAADVMRRLEEHKLKLGEDVKKVDGKVEISGQVAVMAINALLAEIVFDENTNREFYVEESLPLDWMYPCLEPHDLILKLNRKALAQLPAETIARDHEYWRKLVAGMLGDWLDEKTTVREIAEFVDRVYVRHDLKGFTGDPRFIQNDYAKRTFSKLRSSIAGVYAWRARAAMDPAYWFKPHPEAGSLCQEADLGFRQALALCPSSPEALSDYVKWLLPSGSQGEGIDPELLDAVPVVAEGFQQHSNRVNEARLFIETVLKQDPQNAEAKALLKTLKGDRPQQGRIGGATNNLANLERQVRTNPTNSQPALAESSRSEKPGPNEALPLVVSIDSKGILRLGADARPLTIERLKAELLAAVGKTPDLKLRISADKKAPIEQVIKVMDAAKEAKIKSVGLRTSAEKPAPTSALTGAQAEAKAVELANEKAQALYRCQPFQKGRPAELVDGYWVWTDGRPYGAADLEATVKFAADGTDPEVTVNLLDSRLRPVVRRF